ncbi:hypothetical protein MASR2M29_19280 [Spirochaetota bacterium]
MSVSIRPEEGLKTVFLDEIIKRLDQKACRFVFPSEAAAQSALLGAIKKSGKKALAASRFISWDSYKALVFPGLEDKKPASKAVRLLFANGLLSENENFPFLRTIIPTEAAKQSMRFLNHISASLPALFAIPESKNDILKDWAEIKKHYSAFMEERGFYEPSWLARKAAKPEGKWLLLFPDLVSDWDDYSGIISDLPDTELLLSDWLGNEKTEARHYNTIVEELRALLMDLHERMQKEPKPKSVIISLASPDSMLPILKREAAMAGVRLNTRKAKTLAESCGGRLFRDILAIAGSRTDFSALRRLIMDGSRPWKEAATGKRLLKVGIEKHLLTRLPDAPDSWEEALAHDSEAKSLYKGLKSSAQNIKAAENFSDLKTAFDKFKWAFFYEEKWNKLQNDEIARAMILLDELAEAAQNSGLKSISNAAELYTAMLEESLYLEASASGGIFVYPFPAAAGAFPDLHYVVNLNQKASAALSRPMAFLRADVRSGLGISDRDMSAGLIRLLAQSGQSTVLSYSRDGPDGVSPPHYVLKLGDADYRTEAWLPNQEAAAQTLSTVFPVQKLSAGTALKTVFPGSKPDWSKGLPAKPQQLAAFSKDAVIEHEYRNSKPLLSATSMEEYDSCSFRRIYSRVLGIRETESGLSFIDNRLLGDLYHKAFFYLLTPIAEKKLGFVAAAAAGEKSRPDAAAAAKAMEKAMANLEQEEGQMTHALAKGLYPLLLNSFTDAVFTLREQADGYKVLYADNRWLEAGLDNGGIMLRGRPDLVCTKEIGGGQQKVIIIDFKKKKLPSKKQQAFQPDGSLIKLQIPVYSLLAESMNLGLEKAFLLSIEGEDNNGAKASLVLAKDKLGRQEPAIYLEDKDRMHDALKEKAGLIAKEIANGKVFVPKMEDRAEVCASCYYKALCRVHYTMR